MFTIKPPAPVPEALLSRGRHRDQDSDLDGTLWKPPSLRELTHSPSSIPDPDPFEERRKPKTAKRRTGNRKKDVTGEVIRAMRRTEASIGLPNRDDLTWCEVQMWDNGPRASSSNPGHIQYKLRIAAMNTDPGNGKCRTRSNRIEAEVRLASIEQFYIRAARKKRAWVDGECDAINQAMFDALTLGDEVGGDPVKTLVGTLGVTGVKGLGFLRYPPTQYAVVTWKADPDTGPRPIVTLFFTGGGSLQLHFRQTDHTNPKASRWYAGWFA